MLKWFYDSLETLQKVDFATKKDYINLWLGVLISVVVFGAYFIGVDTIASGLYKTFYTSMRGQDIQLEQQLSGDSLLGNDSGNQEPLLNPIDLWNENTPITDIPFDAVESSTKDAE